MLPRSRWQKTLSWSMLMASIIAVPISTRWGIIDPAGGGEWEAITRCWIALWPSAALLPSPWRPRPQTTGRCPCRCRCRCAA